MLRIILDEPLVGTAIPPNHGPLTFHLPIDELSFIAFDLRFIAVLGVLEPTLAMSDAVQVLARVPVPIKVSVLAISVLLSPVEVPGVPSAISECQSAPTLEEVVHPMPIVLSVPI
jgi:hypothetical protein